MSSQVITYEASEDEVQILDQVAHDLNVDRATVLRQAIAQLHTNSEELNTDIDEARRQIDAGHYTLHEDVVREFRSRNSKTRAT